MRGLGRGPPGLEGRAPAVAMTAEASAEIGLNQCVLLEIHHILGIPAKSNARSERKPNSIPG
jgi:hypothetical protein